MELTSDWTWSTFAVASMDGPVTLRGYSNGLLGLAATGEVLAFPIYVLFHLGTGAEVFKMPMPFEDSMAAAKAIAAAGDWDFADLLGWQNMSPDLPDKISAIALRYGIHLRPKIEGRKVSAGDREAAAAAGAENEKLVP